MDFLSRDETSVSQTVQHFIPVLNVPPMVPQLVSHLIVA